MNEFGHGFWGEEEEEEGRARLVMCDAAGKESDREETRTGNDWVSSIHEKAREGMSEDRPLVLNIGS